MNNGVPVTSSACSELVRILDDCLARLQAGESLDKRSLLDRHPELADDLEACLESLEFIGRTTQCSSASADDGDSVSSARSRPLGDFILGPEIGRGGMGVVYKAEQISLGRTVALKVLPFAAMLDTRQLARFRNEARAAASLEHPHIVPVYSIGCERGVNFYAMKFIEGESLARVIEQLRRENGIPDGEVKGSAVGGQGGGGGGAGVGICRGPCAVESIAKCDVDASRRSVMATLDEPTIDLRPPTSGSRSPTPSPQSLVPSPQPPAADTVPVAHAVLSTVRSTSSKTYFRNIAELGIQAAEAVDYAHEQGVIHRDIKPANLLLDESGRLWITDFGLARLESDAGMTMTGDLVGTLRYMSPEQALAKRVVVDHRTDIYSLGVTLYELLALRPAFDGADRQKLLKQIAFDDPHPLRKLNRQIPVELETIIDKAVRKDQADRYSTARELAEDLRNFLQSKPIKAKPPTRRNRLTKWLQRHPAAVWATIFTLLGTTLISAVSATLVIRAVNREAVQQSRAESKQRAAAAFQDLFFDSFNNLDPNLDGRTLTISETLDHSVKIVEDRLDNDQLLKAQLLETIGETYLQLRLPGDAIPVFAKTRDLLAGALGRDDRATLAAKARLAQAYREDEQIETGLSLHEEVFEARRRSLGPNDPDTIESMQFVAEACGQAGRILDAITITQDALSIQSASCDENHADVIATMNELTVMYLNSGRPYAALAMAQTAFEAAKEHLSPKNGQTLDSRMWLARALEECGWFEKAIGLHQEALELNKSMRGDKRMETLFSMNDLAHALCDAGRIDEAIRLEKAQEKIHSSRRGSSTCWAYCTSSMLAELYRMNGRLSEAQTLLEETLPRQKALRGTRDREVLESMRRLAHVYADQGRLADAARLLDETVVLQKRAIGIESIYTLDTMRASADVHLRLNEIAQAESVACECLGVCESRYADDWRLFASRSLLGAILLAKSDFKEAEPLLHSGYDGMQSRFARIRASDKRCLRDSIERLAQVYEHTNQPIKAAEWRVRLAEFDQAAKQANNPVSKSVSATLDNAIPEPANH